MNPAYGTDGRARPPDEAFDKIMGSNAKSNLWLCNPREPPARSCSAGRGGCQVLAPVLRSSWPIIAAPRSTGAYLRDLQGRRLSHSRRQTSLSSGGRGMSTFPKAKTIRFDDQTMWITLISPWAHLGGRSPHLVPAALAEGSAQPNVNGTRSATRSASTWEDLRRGHLDRRRAASPAEAIVTDGGARRSHDFSASLTRA